MTTAVTILFVLSLIVIVALFVLKSLEQSGKVSHFALRRRVELDTKIISTEQYIASKCTQENAKRLLSHVYNTITHNFAKAAAGIAKKVEWRARSVAHKSAKARRDTEQPQVAFGRGSDFLKDVQSYKDSLDTTKVAEQSKL